MCIPYKSDKKYIIVAMFPGIQVHCQDVQHPFPTMLSCICGAYI